MKIDLLSPSSFASGHPHAQYRWLREHAPVYWHEEPGGPGFWAVTRFEDVRAMGRDPETFSSEPTIMIADPAGGAMTIADHKMMLMMDPPQHTAFRRLISREFTQAPAAALRPRVEALARQIVDRVIDRGECDFVADIAGEMPSYVIAELMGIPLDDGRKLYQLTETIHSAAEAVPDGAQAAAVMEMFTYAHGVIQEKRARPANDLSSKLLAAEVDGRKLDDIDFQLFFLLLVDAGGDTTRNLVAAGLLALLDHPDEFARLRADLDALLPSARDELLRWVSPVIYMRRTARRDTAIAGQAIKAGDKVVRYFGAANFDERAFADPYRLDLSRNPNPHIAFGAGAHVCLGQHIARVEIDALLREVMRRMDAIELAEQPEWLPSNFISGPKRMPIRFRAA
ncbi:MAG TPA: cytochrome P450 [Pseudomonadales bacterium]|nr:cytochrome P450 [Pseudomonadales bacterium]